MASQMSAVPTYVKYSKQGILIVAKIHSSCVCMCAKLPHSWNFTKDRRITDFEQSESQVTA